MLHVICLMVLLGAMTITLRYLTRNRQSSIVRVALYIVLVVYIIGYLYFAFLSRESGSESRVNIVPFQSYVHLFDGSLDSERFATTFKAIGLESTSPAVGMLLNILLYYPLGYLLPILFPKLKPKHIILIGCLCSIATEATQYLLKMGWCETDDVIHNTLGTAIGMWVWHLQSKRLNKQKSNELPKD